MLSVIDFGRQLVETEDLDPVYTMLWKAQLEPEQLRRWLLAYWCFYDSGTVSCIVDGGPGLYWARMKSAAYGSAFPRGTERRHFRGALSRKSVDWLEEAGIDTLFTPFTAEEGERLPLAQVMSWVQEWVGFGPWIAFKVADMLERLDLCAIDFSDADTFLFDSPKEGAKLVAEKYGRFNVLAQSNPQRWAIDYLSGQLGKLSAPPRHERYLNGQEYETILCKWLSHTHGHYEVGKDKAELRHGLLHFARCKTSQRLLKCL